MCSENNKIIKSIKENYASLEEGIVNQLYFAGHHGSTIGHYREKIWSEMFKNIVPKKFVIEQSVFLIDSQGNVSNEVDLAIFDDMYTPYIFRYYDLKFIPIEAVAVVVECKSKSMKEEELRRWTESISELKTSPSQRSFTRIVSRISFGPAETQKATRPLRILSCLNEEYKAEMDKIFDVVIRAQKDTKRLDIKWNEEQKNLFDWYWCLNQNHVEKPEKPDKITGGDEAAEHTLDEYKVFSGKLELSLMSFNFQLNQIIMLINNPMMFPHLEYVEMFNRFE